MIAGLPGTAIGGAFYLLMAAWVHVKRTINKLRGVGAPEDNRVGTGFLVLTVCIIAALVATSWLAGWLAVGIAVDIPGVSHTAQVETLLQFSAILLTFVILLALVVGVHGLRLVTSGRTPAPVRLPGQLLPQRHFLYSVAAVLVLISVIAAFFPVLNPSPLSAAPASAPIMPPPVASTPPGPVPVAAASGHRATTTTTSCPSTTCAQATSCATSACTTACACPVVSAVSCPSACPTVVSCVSGTACVVKEAVVSPVPTNASTSTNQSQIVINNNNVHSPVKVFAPYNDDFSKVVIKDREVIFKPSPHPDLT